mmetsp:Transcript_38740/g.82295  ORF Transcript_38740/g.82295 Transcript_38740/m.82295 type:complete len:384 (+) Transcript_38740:67-1218(+)
MEREPQDTPTNTRVEQAERRKQPTRDPLTGSNLPKGCCGGNSGIEAAHLEALLCLERCLLECSVCQTPIGTICNNWRTCVCLSVATATSTCTGAAAGCELAPLVVPVRGVVDGHSWSQGLAIREGIPMHKDIVATANGRDEAEALLLEPHLDCAGLLPYGNLCRQGRGGCWCRRSRAWCWSRDSSLAARHGQLRALAIPGCLVVDRCSLDQGLSIFQFFPVAEDVASTFCRGDETEALLFEPHLDSASLHSGARCRGGSIAADAWHRSSSSSSTPWPLPCCLASCCIVVVGLARGGVAELAPACWKGARSFWSLPSCLASGWVVVVRLTTGRISILLPARCKSCKRHAAHHTRVSHGWLWSVCSRSIPPPEPTTLLIMPQAYR